MISILLDTSFLITLSNPDRPNHGYATKYLAEALRSACPLYLSAIVASEFEVMQRVTDLPLRNMIVLPFNIDHAMKCGRLVSALQRDEGDDRTSVKDDVKLIAQMDCEGITHILTEDSNTLHKYLVRLNAIAHSKARAILLKDGFDPSWFNGGQAVISV